MKTKLYDEDAERQFCSGYQLTLPQRFSARTVGRVGESQAHPWVAVFAAPLASVGSQGVLLQPLDPQHGELLGVCVY